jgi:hypothetical protein
LRFKPEPMIIFYLFCHRYMSVIVPARITRGTISLME